MQRTAYVSPRVNNAVTLVPGFSGASVICPATLRHEARRMRLRRDRRGNVAIITALAWSR